jgi:hypothetical protein
MGRYLITMFLAFLCCLPSMVRAAEKEERVTASRLLGSFSPKTDVWSEYAIYEKAAGRRTLMRISIVGIDQDAYWYEMGNRADTTTSIIKMLVKGDPIYPENILRLIIKSGPGPAREMGGDLASTGAEEAGRMFEEQCGIPVRTMANLKTVKTGEGTATVPAGTFDVSLHEIVDKAGRVYARYKFSQEVRPFGIVNCDTDTRTMVLVAHGTGAKSLITEEPETMTQPPGMGQGGIIMQIPGMGTGYEIRQ